jgi:hypothetical protein
VPSKDPVDEADCRYGHRFEPLALVDLVRPDEIVPTVAAQIKVHLQASSAAQHAYSLVLVPRATALCRRILEDEGVLGDVQLVEYPLRWIPLERDVLSLELGDAAKEIFLVRASPGCCQLKRSPN